MALAMRSKLSVVLNSRHQKVLDDNRFEYHGPMANALKSDEFDDFEKAAGALPKLNKRKVQK